MWIRISQYEYTYLSKYASKCTYEHFSYTYIVTPSLSSHENHA